MNDLKEKKFRNIIFDLDGTLVHKRPGLLDIIHQFLNQIGVVLTEEQKRQAGLWSHKFWDEPENYFRDPDKSDEGNINSFWHKYMEFYGEMLSIGAHDLKRIGSELAHVMRDKRRHEYLAADSEDVLSILLKNQFKMGVLSNRYSQITMAIEEYQLSDYFVATLTAGELGAMKPDKEIFHLFLEIFGGSSDDTVYVGDNYWLDVKGAMNAGLQPILIDPHNWYRDVDCPVIRDLSDLLPIFIDDTESLP